MDDNGKQRRRGCAYTVDDMPRYMLRVVAEVCAGMMPSGE